MMYAISESKNDRNSLRLNIQIVCMTVTFMMIGRSVA
jgi:hypothetical protein